MGKTQMCGCDNPGAMKNFLETYKEGGESANRPISDKERKVYMEALSKEG